MWDPSSRKLVSKAAVNTVKRKAKRNRASTMGEYPDSQSARAVTVNIHIEGVLECGNKDVCVCANDGSVTIRKSGETDKIVKEIDDSREWIEVAEYSPDGKYLAVGSHDTNIYVYDVEKDYDLVGKCTAHNATITCIDWCMHSKYIRSVCNGYELLFHTVPDCK
jgi:WD40 repeat protein